MRAVKVAFAVCVLLCFSSTIVRGDVSSPAVHQLSNGIINVTIMDPNSSERYYRGARFSPVAFVLTAIKDGKSYFYCPADHDPEKDGAGLAMEFDILTPGGPPGFKEAAIGEGFLKVGVGVLRKLEKHYRFEKTQELIEPAVTTLSIVNEKAVFQQKCAGINGYAYSLSATVALIENSISISYVLTNTGKQEFITENYAHNFFSFDGRKIGPDYEITLPYEISEPIGLPLSVIRKGLLKYNSLIEGVVNFNVPYPSDYHGANIVLVKHHEATMEIQATTSLTGTRTFLHASPDYVSPEQMVRIHLKAGQQIEWSRVYRLGPD